MASLKALLDQGQSMWLDYMRRRLIISGELEQLVRDGLRGVTSNPDIFKKAIADSTDYDDALRGLLESDANADVKTLYESLAIEDIQQAAGVLRPVYDETKGVDGFVSLEVSPHLAHDTDRTIAEARRLWKLLNRPNVMIKVPATEEGIPAIETLISQGINVNVTLMFSLDHYEAVANAYLRGLERCTDTERVSSVASFFVSRVNRMVDPALAAIGTPEATRLLGKAAIANAQFAYQRFKEIFYGKPFAPFKDTGARVQRCLWASTSTKNPEYSDVLYVEELIGPDTVNTAPPSTVDAFRDHGRAEATLEKGLHEAGQTLRRLSQLGIELDSITAQLQEEGVKAFAESFDGLLAALQQTKESFAAPKRPLTLNLGEYEKPVHDRIQSWQEDNFACRLWRKDPTLWFDQPVSEITDRLGWLVLPEAMEGEIGRLAEFVQEIKNEGIRHVVLLGMGGSSLAPEVFQQVFGNADGYPEVLVLDSTHPTAIRAVEKQISLKDSLFLVSSKSGTTTETLSFFYYFWKRLNKEWGDPGPRFVAITDPGTPLEKLAAERKFRQIFRAPHDLGGRYAALSLFGLVPAALIGLELEELLDRARSMVEACAFCVPCQESPALELGAALGELARAGRDKVTLVMSPALSPFSAWLEQLIAESTGKQGKGILPVADEPLGPSAVYGKDRFFVATTLEGDRNEDLVKKLAELESLGHPVARITLGEKLDLGREIVRWELAVASAGAVLGIHPFNQPDVELAKKLARKAMQGDGGPGTGDQKDTHMIGDSSLSETLKSWLGTAQKGDYLALQAYLAPSAQTTAALQQIRVMLRNRLGVATTFGYGPRFLHSTGQLHKGGANNGLFLQLFDDPAQGLSVPETDYTFGKLIHAQAVGDYQALAQRKRRVLRIQLGKNAVEGLKHLENTIQ